MSITGKGSKSIRKLPVAESLLTNTGFKVTRALHEASEGDTLIQLGSLTAPSTAVNYSAPNPSELTSTNIMAYQENVRLSSSLRGLLMKNLAWIANGASTIKLLFEAEEAEVFEIIIDHNVRTSVQLVDASSQPVSGTLLATQSDFNVGVPFEVGKFSAIAQHGVYMILVDGQLVFRNTGNSAPGPGVTGDYYEVHAGAGLGTLIRFNNVDLINDRAISAIPVGALVERPSGSQLALIEALQGQVDALVPTVASLADVDETDFQAAPNNIDLKAFGDRVLQAEQDILGKEDEFEVPFQIKFLSSTITVDTVNILDLRFNNLEVGKTYKVTVHGFMGNAAGSSGSLDAIHNGIVIARAQSAISAGGIPFDSVSEVTRIFVATANTLTFNFEEPSDSALRGDGGISQTFVMLEELPQHIATTQWT